MKCYTTVFSCRKDTIREFGLKSNKLSGYVEVYSSEHLASYASHPGDDILLELEVNEDDMVETTGNCKLLKRNISPDKITMRKLRLRK